MSNLDPERGTTAALGSLGKSLANRGGLCYDTKDEFFGGVLYECPDHVHAMLFVRNGRTDLCVCQRGPRRGVDRSGILLHPRTGSAADHGYGLRRARPPKSHTGSSSFKKKPWLTIPETLLALPETSPILSPPFPVRPYPAPLTCCGSLGSPSYRSIPIQPPSEDTPSTAVGRMRANPNPPTWS